MAPGISTRERLRLNLRPRLIPTISTMDSTATDTHTPMAMDSTMATTCTRGRPKLRPSLRPRLILTSTTMATTALHTDTHMATATHTDMVPTDTHTATDTTTRLLKSQPFDLIIPKNTIKMSSYPFYLNKKKTPHQKI